MNHRIKKTENRYESSGWSAHECLPITGGYDLGSTNTELKGIEDRLEFHKNVEYYYWAEFGTAERLVTGFLKERSLRLLIK